MKLPPQINKAIGMLENAGFCAFIVGGCVRDHLLGKAPFDYDLTTSALPGEVEAVFSHTRIIETGLKHGTVTVIMDGLPIEITTFRKEGSYSDGRHPDRVEFTANIEEDLKRRDFTINAIAYSPSRGIVDCFGGQADLQGRIIRAVGEPDLRFNEDALRIMRALRFSSTLGFEIEEATHRAIFANRKLLRRISGERIREELLKLLCGKDVRRVLMNYPQVIGVFIPEFEAMVGFDQKNPHHIYDLLEHTAAVVESIEPQPVLRLAALLHDIGKPATFTIDEKGIGHFYGHGKAGCKRAKAILEELRPDKATANKVLALILHHDEAIVSSERAVKRALSRLGSELFFDLLKLKEADNKGQNIDRYNHLEEYEQLRNLARRIIDENQCFSLKNLAIKGDDLLALGFKGKAVGKTLEKLLNAVIDGRVENEKDKLRDYVKRKLL